MFAEVWLADGMLIYIRALAILIVSTLVQLGGG